MADGSESSSSHNDPDTGDASGVELSEKAKSPEKNGKQLVEKIDTKKKENPAHTMKDGEKISIPRDWARGIGIRFDEKFPDQLKGHVSEDEWRHTISAVNANFAEAESANFATFVEGCLGILTCFSIWLCLESRYDKFLQVIEDIIIRENKGVYNPKGFHIHNPKKTGYLYVSF